MDWVRIEHPSRHKLTGKLAQEPETTVYAHPSNGSTYIQFKDETSELVFLLELKHLKIMHWMVKKPPR